MPSSLPFLLAAAALPSVGATFDYQSISDPLYSSTRPFGINDNGVVSGDHGGGSIFTYSSGTFTQYSQTDGAALTYDTRINNAGDLVGTDGGLYAFTLINGTATRLSVPSFGGNTIYDSFGSGINNTGTILGGYIGSDGQFGFELQNGTYTQIRFPGSTSTEPLGINDSNDVVGAYSLGSGAVHGFLLHNGVYTTIDGPGSGDTYVWGINNAGHYAVNQNGGGFFYDGAAFTTLEVPGFSGVTVLGMNNLDQIVGTYNNNGATVGFIATSETSGTPEPGTLLLSVGCMGICLLARRYRRSV